MNRPENLFKSETGAAGQQESVIPSGQEVDPKSIFLHPGETYAAPDAATLSIILGSCVAVCLFNERLSLGGATHYLLPTLEGEGKPSARYGDIAIKELLSGLRLLGSRNKDLRAYVFGGASILNAFRDGSQERIGDKNIQLALQMLSEEAIPIHKRDTGGKNGRKITMRTNTGATTVRLIGN